VKFRFGGEVPSREELEADAARAIEARVGLGRPPEEDFKPIEARLAEIDAVLAPRPQPEPFPTAKARAGQPAG
jgi:hypothetical protein